ncbi:MAG: hypothetical protein J2O48_00225, partial [Solirubrobacterales bacterium]|nr:hypothetical protein [Solirubrobacterales bacterium]
AAEACRAIQPARVARLHTVADRIAAAAGVSRAAGAVQSVPVGSASVAYDASVRLGEEGIVVGCFRPPSVPDGISRLRLTARATVDPDVAAQAAAQAAALVA